LVNGGDGADTLIGGAGFDLLDYAASTVGVHIDLEFNDAAFGDAAGDEIAGFEGVRGSIRADTLTGSADANWLAGGSNNDVLSGGAGNDTRLGEVGADTLIGGPGADLLIGSNLPDVFRYLAVSDSTPAASGRDRIRDFRQADLDKIDLSAIDAVPGQPGDQPFTFIGAAPFTGVQGQLRAAISGAVTIVEADTDGNAVADLRIVLNGAITMAATDFVL
jgi:Ca2+-binding RTX toxin-like protein